MVDDATTPGVSYHIEDEAATMELFVDDETGQDDFLLLSLDKLLPAMNTIDWASVPAAHVLRQLQECGVLDEDMAFQGVLASEVTALAQAQHSRTASRDAKRSQDPLEPQLEQPAAGIGVLMDSDEERAVLCTRDATFSVWRQETSNSLLLCEPHSWERGAAYPERLTVRSIEHFVLQSQRTTPSFKSLQCFLRCYALYGRHSQGIPWNQLLHLSHASSQELHQRLAELGLVYDASTSAYWILDKQDRERVLEHVLDTMLVHALPHRSLSRSYLEKALLEMSIIDQTLVHFALEKWFARSQQSAEDLDLRVDAIIRDLVPVLMRRYRGAVCTLEHLLECLQRRLPSSIQLKSDNILRLLDGIAIIRPSPPLHSAADRASVEATKKAVHIEAAAKQMHPLQHPHSNENSPLIQLLEAENLPRDPETRLGVLFEIKKQWTQAELEPYTSDLPTSTLQRLLRPIRGPISTGDQDQRFEARSASKPRCPRPYTAIST
jgi:hypothetical protein